MMFEIWPESFARFCEMKSKAPIGPAPLLAAACVCAAALSAHRPARAQDRAAYEAVQLVGAVPVKNGATAATVLVGSSGQLYKPAADSIWRRDSIGGVAADLTEVVDDGRGKLFAAASRAPIFRFSHGAWSAHPLPNRGRATMASAGGTATLAVGRHVYTLRGSRWVRLVRAPKRIVALWAGGSRRVYVADSEGAIRSSRGRTWNDISHSLAADDRVDSFVGVPGKELYAIARSGTVLSVGAKSAAPVTAAADLAGFRVQAACRDLRPGQGGVLLIGTSTAPEGASQTVLATANGGKLLLLEKLPAPASGDAIVALFAGSDGEILLATRLGEVRVRGADGTWRVGRVSGEVPASATRSSLSEAGPAHTR